LAHEEIEVRAPAFCPQKLHKSRIAEFISPSVWRDDCADFQEHNRMVYLGTAKSVPLKPIR
jgi:hypothetical protein